MEKWGEVFMNANPIIGLVILLGIFFLVLLLALGLLVMLFATSVYFWGYAYDCIMGDWPIRIAKYIADKFPGILKNKWSKRIWELICPKEFYFRYETPFITYCCSFMVVYLISLVPLPLRGGRYMIASVLYLLVYFVGMCRKYKNKEDCLDKVLENNMEFLKLSFLPITFLITIVGFGFTATGLKIQDFNVDWVHICDVITNYFRNDVGDNLLSLCLHIVICGFAFLLIFYVVSLPMQVIAFFIITVIKYFKKYGRAYRELINKLFRYIK